LNHGIVVEMINGGHEAVLESLFGCDADVTKDGASEFGNEALGAVEPEAGLGVRVNSKRCVGWPASQSVVCLEMCAE
jgi:hypothetical protein